MNLFLANKGRKKSKVTKFEKVLLYDCVNQPT